MIQSPTIPIANSDTLRAYVRLARSDDEIREAQKLRYAVFYEEYGAQASDQVKAEKRDFDDFDDITDHLIVLVVDTDTKIEKIVGTYRLLRQEVAEKHGRFYSDAEYNLDKLIASDNKLLELGRSCVLIEYRTKPILNLLWQGIYDYIGHHSIDLLFGCASFHGTNIDEIANSLSYLHHFHLTPKEISPVALPDQYIDMNIISKDQINERKSFASLPPLIKGYVRLGATIGEGAVIDKPFNTTDVCIVVQTKLMTDRYRKHYERKVSKVKTT